MEMNMEMVMRVADLEAHANMHTVRRAFHALLTGNAVGVDEFVSPHYLDHDAPGADEARPGRGPAAFRDGIGWLHGILANLEFHEQELLAVSDRVMVRGVMRGKHVGRVLGLAPTGKRVEVHQVHVFRLAGGKLVEHRAFWGELSLLVQLMSEQPAAVDVEHLAGHE
jgi:nogalonic acid methyl ester cyclase/aklanonic acid methyl ester cyclase